MSIDFTSKRLSYEQGELVEADLPITPYPLLDKWVQQAIADEESEAYAFYLATCGLDRQPAVRTLLMRELKERPQSGIGLIFYSNYDSAKGSDLAHNPQAEALFYWPSLERQVRLTGAVQKLSQDQSASYFHSRPRDSQLAAWVSEPQSSVVENRTIMEDKFAKLTEQYQDSEIPLPDFWGGYELVVAKIEFWQGRANRMHDRVVYSLDTDRWVIERLLP